MSEIRNEISKMNIRGELNLFFVMSKLIVSILDAAEDNEIACDTLLSVSESLMTQAAYLYGRISIYADEVNRSE